MHISEDPSGGRLTETQVGATLSEALADCSLSEKRVLVVVPDGTRSAPIDMIFAMLHELLWDRVAALDFMFALGTHQPMPEKAMLDRLGMDERQRKEKYAGVKLLNHHWERPDTFRKLGVIPAEEIERLSRGLLSVPVEVTVNKAVFDYDLIILCGPVFPHEVVGFSGGNKYLFPGIAGRQIIDVTHWLGALISSCEIIGTKHTPVRAVIDRAAGMLGCDTLGMSMVVSRGGMAGFYVGEPREAWSRAADLSARLHVRYTSRRFDKVLSVMPAMYEDIWTAAKGMYKLEPVVADGGEVIIYAPHIDEFSYTHGEVIERVGYHVRDYFVQQWERFENEPWGVLAHSTHLRGAGEFSGGVERPRIEVGLATSISEERCRAVNLGYRDPAGIDPRQWANREEDGVLLVPDAGETLYRPGKEIGT